MRADRRERCNNGGLTPFNAARVGVVRRSVLVLIAVLALAVAAAAPAAAPAPPRALKVSTGGRTLAAVLVHTCIQTGDQRSCTAPQTHFRGSLKLRAGASVTLRFDRSPTAVTAQLENGFVPLGHATKARGSGRTYRWTAPKSLGKANRLSITGSAGRSDAEFAVAIKRG